MDRNNIAKAKPDKDQNEVIKDRNHGNLLVSASAGAGKTKVLVSRVINEIEPHVDLLHGSKIKQLGIANFLIVTFTRAAAEEMKQRIRKGLQNKINGSTSQVYREALLRQIGDLPTANIGTLDAFCQKVVAHYYYVIGLDPNFRTLNDNTELLLLRDQVWRDVREKLYDKDDDQFSQLVATFFKRHYNADDELTDPLTSLVYDLYDSYRLYVYEDYVDKNKHKDISYIRKRIRAINSDPEKLFNAWSANVSQMYNIKGSLMQSPFYKKVLSAQLITKLNQILDKYQNALNIATRYGLKTEHDFVLSESDAIKSVRNLINLTVKTAKSTKKYSWDQICDRAFKVARICKHQFPRKAKTTDKAEHVMVRDARKKGKDEYYMASDPKSFCNRFFSLDEQHNKELISHSYRIIQELLRVVKLFSLEYRQVKQQRHVLEFTDIERDALMILEKNRDVRAHFQQQFHEIMIDEYQDDNQLQDAIINLVAKYDSNTHDSTNIFMVGDVKQSIYRFRHADPKLFIKKYKAYQKSNSNDNQLLKLNRNYRSTRNIDRFVNLIFNQIMNDQLGGIDYFREPENFGATNYEKPANLTDSVKEPVHIMIYDQFTKNASDRSLEGRTQKTDNTKGEIQDSDHGQIEMVAQAIRRMVNNPHKQILVQKPDKTLIKRPIHYKDIALIASTRDDNPAIADVFRRYHIPVQMLGSQNYFKTTEVQVMLSLLELIDNPDQDIPLVAVLRSPMVGLDENQLAYLRIDNTNKPQDKKKGHYYRSVKDFYNNYPINGYKTDSHNYGKKIYDCLTRFFNNLKKFRKITQRHGLVDLIWSIYQTTGFLDYVGGMPAGVQRQANLHALYERAAQYEQANFHGLFQFVRFIHQLQNQQKDLTDAVPQQGKDMVTSVTIHNSKGREFNVVFLLDTSRHFNKKRLQQDYILSNDFDLGFGLGMKYFNTQLHLESSTLPYQCVKAHESREETSEEMRKLYVALTRTKQRLYIVGRIIKAPKHGNPRTNLFKRWENLANDPKCILDLAKRLDVSNYLDWIGASLVRLPSFRKRCHLDNKLKWHGLRDNKTNVDLTFSTDRSILYSRKVLTSGRSVKLISKPLEPRDKKFIKDVMYLKYRHRASTREGNYRSVSDVKQLFADPNNVEMGQLDQIHHHDNHGRFNQYIQGDFATPKFIQSGTKPKATEIGTATHLVLQMMKLHPNPTKQRIEATLHKLVKYQMVDKDVAEHVNIRNVESFFYNNPLGDAIRKAPQDYHRETPFSLLVKAHRIMPEKFKVSDPESILIHGIIDGYFRYRKNNHNHVFLVDYKTDYVDFKHKNDSINKIMARYQGQLNLYGTALKSIYGQDSLKYKGLYLLSSHQLVPRLNPSLLKDFDKK